MQNDKLYALLQKNIKLVIRVKGIEPIKAAFINDLISLQSLIDLGSFREINTLPDIHIYVNKETIDNSVEVMLVFKDGQLIDRLLRRS